MLCVLEEFQLDVFLCFFNYMYFIVFVVVFHYPTIIQLFWPQNKHLKSKQDQITNVLPLYLKNEISECFVTQITKTERFSGWHCEDKSDTWLCHGRSDKSKNFFQKLRKTRKKGKSQNFSARFSCVKKLSRKMSRGGLLDSPPPPPPRAK